MNFKFFDAEDLISGPQDPVDALGVLDWEIQPHNAPFLAGKGPEASRKMQRLPAPLPDVEITEDDRQKIMGDINDTLSPNVSSVIVARTPFLTKATETAAKLGYRPVRTGEFLQLMWCIVQKVGDDSPLRHFPGHFFCWEGRVPGYAIMAQETRGGWSIIFDTQIDDLDYVSSNVDCNCFFVKEESG